MNEKNELAHHGVIGMKWGVRNGPPYPLGASQKTAKEKKQSTSRHANKISNIDAGKRFISSKMASGDISGDMTVLAAQAATYLVATGIMAAVAKYAEKKLRKQYNEELEERYMNRNVKKLDDLPKLSDKTTASDSVKVTNPGYPKVGRTDNCTFCTTATALREKGFDVRAQETDHGWHTDDLFTKAFGATINNMRQCRNSDQMLKTLSSHGDGAYGNLTIYWRGGGGHSVFWKNENGRTNIYDGQQGKQLNLRQYEYLINPRSSQYQRLDNCDPTDYVLALVEPND